MKRSCEANEDDWMRRSSFRDWGEKDCLPCRDHRTRFFPNQCVTSPLGETSSNSKPKAGLSDALPSADPLLGVLLQLSWSHFPAPLDQLRTKLWELSIIGPSLRSFLLGGFPVFGSFSLSFDVFLLPSTIFLSLEISVSAPEPLPLFSCQNPFWDSILVHPSIQPTTVETRKLIQSQHWGPSSASALCYFVVGWCLPFPMMLQDNCLFQSWIVLSLLLPMGPASKTQIRKDGTLKKKRVCAILAFPVPIADFLCFEDCRVRRKLLSGKGSGEK